MFNILENLTLAEKIGVQIGERTRQAIHELENPTSTIAIVGCFQVGKTTLVNRVFLDENSPLKEGDGRCTTAIATQVVYGEHKRLTVFYRDPQTPPKTYEENEITPQTLEELAPVCETDENARQQQRLEIARTVRYVRLEHPCDSLKRTVFYDTPGVDDPNRELVDLTTAEFLGKADLVVLVVNATRTLDQYTREFLAKSVFQQGLSRVVVLASYNPNDATSAENRKQILNTIRAELANMGREYIPVYAYTFDESVDGDILRGAVQIRATLLEFAEKNTRQAREDRAAFYLREDVIRALENWRAVLLTNNTNEEEREALKNKIDSVIQRMDVDYQNTLSSFKTKYAVVKRETLEQITGDLLNENSSDSQINRFLAQFDKCDSLSDVRAKLDSVTRATKIDLECYFTELSSTIRQKVETVLLEISSEAAQASERATLSFGWNDGYNTGYLGKINPTLLRIGEIALGFGCFNIIGAVVVALAQRIPIIKQILPSGWAKASVLHSLKKSFIANIESAKSNVELQLEQARPQFEEGIREVYQDAFDSKIKPYKERFDEFAPALDAAAIQDVENKIRACEDLISDCDE